MNFKEYACGTEEKKVDWNFLDKRYKFRWVGYNESPLEFNMEAYYDHDLDVLDYIVRDHNFIHQYIHHVKHGQLLHVERIKGELVFHGLDEMINTLEEMKLDGDRDRSHLLSLRTLALSLKEQK